VINDDTSIGAEERNVVSKEDVRGVLICFTDFIYAVVFVLIVQKVFDDLIEKKIDANCIIRILLLGVMFYFLTWDWVLGRILTLKIPYKSYTRFFYEILIAAFAYGTVAAILQDKALFLYFLARVVYGLAMQLEGVTPAKKTRNFVSFAASNLQEVARTSISVATSLLIQVKGPTYQRPLSSVRYFYY
jgi:hypothetical protein